MLRSPARLEDGTDLDGSPPIRGPLVLVLAMVLAVVILVATASSSPSPSAAAADPAGNPTATITSPVAGTSVASGTAVALSALLSSDLITALQAGTSRSCYFTVGDDANSCLGSTSALWSAYGSSRNFAALLAAPQTSAKPITAGTC